MTTPATNVMTPKKRTLSPEHRAKLSEVQRRRWAAGRKVSEESKAKMSESAMGHEVSDQTREKMREAALVREAQRADERLDRIVLSHVWPATVHAPGLSEWFPAVVVSGEDGGREFFVGRDVAFANQQDALAVAVARARARMETNGDG